MRSGRRVQLRLGLQRGPLLRRQSLQTPAVHEQRRVGLWELRLRHRRLPMSPDLLDALRVCPGVRVLERQLRRRFVHGDGADVRELPGLRGVLRRAGLLLVVGPFMPRRRRGVQLVPQRDRVRRAVGVHVEQLELVLQRLPRRMRRAVDATDVRRAEGLRMDRAVLGERAEMQHARRRSVVHALRGLLVGAVVEASGVARARA